MIYIQQTKCLQPKKEYYRKAIVLLCYDPVKEKEVSYAMKELLLNLRIPHLTEVAAGKPP
jgi:hypothetical protein